MNKITLISILFQGLFSTFIWGDSPVVTKVDKIVTEFKPSSNASCEIPKLKENIKSTRKFFLSNFFQNFTCPISIDSKSEMVILDDFIPSFNAKIKSLLGQPLSPEWINQENPYAQLDFSKAPKLKEILISYLVFKRDFSGTVIERLLRFHAERGVNIRIITSNALLEDKERNLLEELNEDFENVQIVFYKYKTKSLFSPIELFRTLHRVQHIKLLITIPEDFETQRGSVIVGGRNIHDGFLFQKAPDFSRYPELIQYNTGKNQVPKAEESFVTWTDMGIKVQKKEALLSIREHFFRLWKLTRSKPSFVESHNSLIKNDSLLLDDEQYFTQDSTYLRHFISFPYLDNKKLEDLFVQMLDSAEKTIFITTPYLNLTDKLKKALARAIKRGIKIKIVTRVDLSGDTIDILLSEVNKSDINHFYKNVELYEYTIERNILHSKMILVDGELVSVGAVNLNKRSFLHDTENTFIFWSPYLHKKFEAIIDDYISESRHINKRLTQFCGNKLLLKFSQMFSKK